LLKENLRFFHGIDPDSQLRDQSLNINKQTRRNRHH
jgi:hypothetical protein